MEVSRRPRRRSSSTPVGSLVLHGAYFPAESGTFCSSLAQVFILLRDSPPTFRRWVFTAISMEMTEGRCSSAGANSLARASIGVAAPV